MDATETATAGYVKQIGKLQTIAQTHVKCADARKVLSISASAYVRVSETLTGEARLAGRETLELAVLTDDGVCRESGWTDFTDRAEIEGVLPTTRVTAIGKVLDTDVVAVDNGNITLASVIEITLYAESEAVIPLTPPQAEGVYTGDSRITLSKLVSRVSGKAEVRSEDRLSFAKLICCDARACVNGAEAGLDAVSVSGEVFIDGLGKTAEGTLQPFTLCLPFAEELGAEGSRRGDTAHVRVLSAVVISEESEDGLSVCVNVELSGEVYSELVVSCAVDAFSPECKLEFDKTKICGMFVSSEKCISDQVDGTVTLPEGENADKVLAMCGFRLSAVTAYPEFGKAVIEGAVSGTVVYADAEAGRKSSCAVELPFKITTDADAPDNCVLDADGGVGKITVRPSRLGELSVRCAISVSLRVSEPTEQEIITGFECGDKLPDRKGVISMHIAREGETLWESAKELCVTPETVLLQNSELSFPLKTGDKVFVFRSR